MRRSSIVDVKAEILDGISAFNTPKAPLSLGRSVRNGENVLAIRIPGQGGFWRNKLEWFRKLTCGEMDVRFVGDITAIPATEPWHRGRVRPLKIGSSISHGAVTAGTLGCFVKDEEGRVCILSNNHVIANSNRAKAGDLICQPGTHDGGSTADDSIAELDRFVKIEGSGNIIDAAVAIVNSDEKYDPKSLFGLGQNSGTFHGEIEPGMLVCKFGRTTNTTIGRVTGVEMDRVGVGGYFEDGSPAFFDQQIEIEGAEDGPFCQGGDSGSVVFSGGRDDRHEALGLLFAGGPRGGSNGKGLTYVNYLSNVLKTLNVTVLS